MCMHVSFFPPPSFGIKDKEMRISEHFYKKYVNLGATLMDKTRKTVEIYIEVHILYLKQHTVGVVVVLSYVII